jgi:XisH protein
VPARNIYHDTVVQALTADGWTITDDPLGLKKFGQLIVTKLELRLIVFDDNQRRIIQWIEPSNTA